MLATGIAVLSLLGTRVSAPDWLRARIMQAINERLPGITLGFQDISVVLRDDWVPRLALGAVTIRDARGVPLAQLSELRCTAALGPLLRGNLQPGTISLSGARMTLRRAADGRVNLQLGERQAAVQEAETVTALLERVETFLARPAFADLERISADNLTLRYEDARQNRAWTVDGGRIEVTREGDQVRLRSDFSLLGARDYATTLIFGYESRIGNMAAEFSIDFEDMPAQDIAGHSPALTWLAALEAPISGRIRAAVDGSGQLGPLDVRLAIAAGALRPTEAARPVPFQSAGLHFTYHPDGHMIELEEARIESSWISTRVSGRTRLTGMEDGWPDAMESQLEVTALSANPMALYPEAVVLDGASVTMRLTLDPFRVTLSDLTVLDKSRRLVLRGDVRADDEGWHLALDGRMPQIDGERVLELWPETRTPAKHKWLKPKTRKWIRENVRHAELSNIEVALRMEPGRRPDIALAFDFDRLVARFMKKMPLIEDAAGHATIFDNRFVITAQRGHVTAAQGGRIDIAGSSFEIPDIRIKRGPGKVRLRTESTITAALSLLNEERFRFVEKAGLPVTLADGMARLSGTLDFLVIDKLRPEDVAFNIAGKLTDLRSEKLVKGRVLAASELDVTASHEGIEIRGEGRIGQVPFGGRWRMPFGKGGGGRSQVEGWIELSERFIEEFGIGLPPGSVSGAGRGRQEIDLERDVPPAFRLQSDLAGVGLRLPQLGWALEQAQTGLLEVAGHLSTPPDIERLAIDAGGLRAEGSVTLTGQGQLQKASFRRVELGTWLDVSLELVGRGPEQAPLVRVLGGRMDLRRTTLARGGGKAGESGPAAAADRRSPLSLRLDRLIVSDTIALTGFSGEFDMSQGPDGRFSGRLNGKAEITGRVVPGPRGASFLIAARDAGAALRAVDMLEGARGGSLDLVLVPQAEPGTYRGKLTVRSIRIRNAPAMAALLNAISVIGLLEQLGGEGIHFGQVEADFLLAPDRITLYAGSAVGASMGISMEGYYYPETGVMDMEGVISPVYALNMLGGIFSRQGEGLIGFKYKIKGPKDAPKVQVNPLSALMPGIFREMFRRPAPRPPSDAGDSDRKKLSEPGLER